MRTLDRDHYSGLDDESKPLRHRDCQAGNCRACDAEQERAELIDLRAEETDPGFVVYPVKVAS